MHVRSLLLRAFLPHRCARRCTRPLVFRSYASMHGHEIDSALGCNVYISEGRDKHVIQHLQAEAAATSGVSLANVFVDVPYNRTGFTFVSTQADRLTAAVVRLSRAALQLLDLRTHAASHPRLGVVDHISLHPLGSLVRRSAASHHHHNAPHPWPAHPEDHYYHHHHNRQQEQRTASQQAGLYDNNQHQHQHHHQRQQHQQQLGAVGGGGPATVWEPPPPGLAGLAVAASCAQYIAWHLSQDEDEDGGGATAAAAAGGGDGAPEALRVLCRAEAMPVYLYGYAHPSRRCLSEVRRQLGYFRRAPDGGWGGGETPALPDPNDLLRYPPDMGPWEPPPQSGLVTIGAVPWVVNYNVPLQDVDLEEAKWLARAVSERGGGLAGVEAMALKHADESVEVACNLLDETVSSSHAVQARLEALASSRGLDQWAVLWGYRTNKTQEELLRAAAAGGATLVERRA